MKKEKFLLITSISVILLLIMYIIYQNKKSEVLSLNSEIYKKEVLLKNVDFLKKQYISKLNISNNKCDIKNGNIIILSCKELNKKEFKNISNTIFNKNYKIKKFNINSNQNRVDFYVEINK